jgi:hypothetical protein
MILKHFNFFHLLRVKTLARRFLSFLHLKLLYLQRRRFVSNSSAHRNMALSCPFIKIPVTVRTCLVCKQLTPRIHVLMALLLRCFRPFTLNFYILLRYFPYSFWCFWRARSYVKWILMLQFWFNKRFRVCFCQRFVLNCILNVLFSKRIVVRIWCQLFFWN